MRVLMLSRDDFRNVPGGDTIQMMQTKSELEKLGAQVTLGTVSQIPPADKYDVVHVFNWEQLEPVLACLENEGGHSTPLVLSTIFWFHTGHWYDGSASRKRVWKWMDRTLGGSRSRLIYEGWQQAKFRRGSRGQHLRHGLLKTSRLLPNSSAEIDHLEVVLGVRGRLRNLSTVVPNGVVREYYDPLPEPNRAFWNEYGMDGFVLEVARIQSAKNQLGLIEALADTSFPIVFVGQPSPYETEYVNRCYEAGKRRGNVYFVSPKTPQELAGIYRLAAVHVLPSWRETPGLASLEAAAAGCRIVSTSIGSVKDYFGDDAWYCDPRDPESIRRGVISALNAAPTHRLRDRVLSCFTWDVAAKTTLDVYRRVAQ